MSEPATLELVLLWHMHQPDYRDRAADQFVLPWTYLHGIKDYTDMADHLERHAAVRAVINFVPILLDQLDDYTQQIERGVLRDPLLQLLAHPNFDALTGAERDFALRACFRSNHHHMLEPFEPYRRLRELYAQLATSQSPTHFLSGAYYADLVTWYHLVWMGESVRRKHDWLVALIEQGEGYTQTDRARLLGLIGTELGALAGRYRALAARGQIELSTTPYAHPLGPLLLDFAAAREALPELALPQAAGYHDGAARLARHCAQAKTTHAARFGSAAIGAWPAEGAISAPLLEIFAQANFAWAASGEAVLANTLHQAGQTYTRAHHLYRPWRDATGVTVFFRDDRLSDLIGFEYAKWDAYDAARHFIEELEAILAAAPADETPLVCVALDGENAWEYYPYNAFYFFEALYAELSAHPSLRTTTFQTVLGSATQQARWWPLPRVCAGSWVHGTLTTWIGEPDKNRAWDLLCAAKTAYDRSAPLLAPAARARAEELLSACEGSDWFWWLGDDNPAPSVASFEHLFRSNLRALYGFLALPPPATLDVPLSHGNALAQDAGTMRRASIPE